MIPRNRYGQIEIGGIFKKYYTVKQIQEKIKSLSNNIIKFTSLTDDVNEALSIIAVSSLLLSNKYDKVIFKYGQVNRLIEIIKNCIVDTLKLFEDAKLKYGSVISPLSNNIILQTGIINNTKKIMNYMPPYDRNIGLTSSGE